MLRVLNDSRAWVLFAALFSLTIVQSIYAESTTESQELVEKARLTVESFLADVNMTWLRNHIKDAKGIFVVPQLLKAAFFFGGSGGSGVLLVRDEKTGDWSDPAFYTLGGGSFGFQFGAQASQVLLLVMTQRGIESLLSTTFKLGADAAIAVGPVGAGMEGASAVLSADLVSFAQSKGLFGGLSLEGAVIAVRNDLNIAYYGKEVRPAEILISRNVSNDQAAALRAAVAKAAGGR